MTYHRLGKFDSARDELLYDLLVSNDWANEHEGHQEDFGAYAWICSIEAPLTQDELVLVAGLAAQIDPDDTELTNSIFGHWIVSVGSQGFVHVESFDSAEAMDVLWQAYIASYARWAESQDEE